MDIEKIHPKQFHYDLPEEKIAKIPLEDRSASKLLYYSKGTIEHKSFKSIETLIPDNSLLVLNDTRVIPARIIFHKPTGARIEVFLLEPHKINVPMEEVMNTTGHITWECMIGNARKWKKSQVLTLDMEKTQLNATLKDHGIVTFEWDDKHTFSEVIEMAGKVPLPPYIDREPTELDTPRYQTVYSKNNGAVAAPTAGLHFTDEILNGIWKTSKIDHVTLHVSAGTFQPIKTSASEHPMHKEQIIVSRKNIENILSNDRVIAVGTTSMRTLESLYWYGVKILNGNSEFFVPKLIAYENHKEEVSLQDSLNAVLKLMDSKGLNSIMGYTEIFIVPGYKFKVCKGLSTNFHMPGTTLMMLIAAFVGNDWKRIYEEALNNDYRFLSYGDTSLLIP